MRARTIAVLVAALLTGCGGVFSKAPASDDATSRYDERLVGFWRIDEDATPGAKGGSLDDGLLVVGKRKDSENGLELVTVTLKRDKTIETSRDEMLATTIGGKDYASVRLPQDKEKPEASGWVVLRYDMPDGDTLRVLGMEEKTAAADVRAEKVAGSVKESKDGSGGEPTLTVTLDVSTTVLRAYLETRGDGVYRTDKPIVLRRLRVR